MEKNKENLKISMVYEFGLSRRISLVSFIIY